MCSKIGECRVSLHEILEVKIEDYFPLTNDKGEELGRIFLSIYTQANTHNISVNRSEMGPPGRAWMENSMQVPHLGRIERSYDASPPDDVPDEDEPRDEEKLQLQKIQEELKEQNNSTRVCNDSIAFKHQEDKIRKSLEQIRHSQGVIKKQKSDLKQTQDGNFRFQ